MMKHTTNPIRYLLFTFRMDLLWLPVGLWGLAAIMVVVMQEKGTMAYNVARSYLGGVLPLIGGILSAYAVLEDPALELQFATPRPGRSLLSERLGVILLILAVCALTFQGFLALVGKDLVQLNPDFWPRQLAWFVPSLAMIAMGSAACFALAQSTAGALLVGGVWIVQVILREWMTTNPIGQYLYLFMSIGAPNHPATLANQLCLLALTALLLWASVCMLKKQERFI